MPRPAPRKPTRPPRPPSEVAAILDAIRHIVREIRVAARAAERQLGLSGAQLFVLHTLEAADPMSLSDLAGRTFTHQSSVSTVVSRLVETGLVERRYAAEDRRRLELALTAAGRARLARAPASAQDSLIAALRRLSDADRRALARSLARLVAALGVPEGRAPMLLEDGEPRGGRARPRRGRR